MKSTCSGSSLIRPVLISVPVSVCLLGLGITGPVAPPDVTAAGQTSAASPTPVGRGGGFVRPEPLDYDDHTGWVSLFDGRTLQGWEGNPEVWKVEDGVITAVSTPERRLGSTHLIWQGGEVNNFEWKLEVKIEGEIHSGMTYRGELGVNRPAAAAAGRQTTAANAPTGPATNAVGQAGRATAPPPQIPSHPRWSLYGPGLDYDADRGMNGNVEDRGTPRRELAWRGGIVRAEPGKSPRLIGSLGDGDALKDGILPEAWNQLHIIALGNQLTHIINGRVMTILIDEDPTFFRAKGLLGIEVSGLGRISVRNIWLRRLQG